MQGTEDQELELADLYERILSAAFRRLVSMDRADAAFPLLDATISDIVTPAGSHTYSRMTLVLGPESYDAFENADYTEYEDEEGTQRSRGLYSSVFQTVVPHPILLGSVETRIRLDPVEAGWREAAYGALKGGNPNQGNLVSRGNITYNGRYYRGRDETVVARELDRLAILFFPLPTASRASVLKEPDLVIVYKGKVGVLEVDGAYHTGRAADDHKRDLFFEQSGIFVKHFNGDDVRSNVGLVVQTFLKLLTGQTR
ncbi:MAG TPA: DUF559 domain-containing protein [Patescibacteria group bacterium]|nr:DUF559 domain-containing protein [Patescibacteria group bacterium]